MKQTVWQVRQGDVFIERIDDPVPAGAKPVAADKGRTVLAYGEVTGHAHALPSSAKLYRMEDHGSGVGVVSWLELDRPATLKHEEHRPIKLPQGRYIVRTHREYSPGEIRSVAD
jgi:hypothetical protein